MSKIKIKYLITLFIIIVGLDIFIRIYYCKGIYLTFNSQDFSNLATPIISFFGFIGLIITGKIALNQFRLQLSVNYFDYYRNMTNRILTENTFSISTLELLDFVSYVHEKHIELMKFPLYKQDLQRFKDGEIVYSTGKDYDVILGQVRLFRTKLGLLLKRYELLLVEMRDHKYLDNAHKDILLKELFDHQILNYLFGLQFIESDQELKGIIEDLYIGFMPYAKEMWPFFDSTFYDLRNLVNNDPFLKKYLNNA
jgi:hypothetical protein